jgi:hypothetical protein
MREAEAAIASADSARYPQVNAAAQSTRERLSANSIYPPPLGGSTVSMNSATVSAAWQFDLFGKQRAALEAAIGRIARCAGRQAGGAGDAGGERDPAVFCAGTPAGAADDQAQIIAKR